MKKENIKLQTEYYVHYWIVKLGLDKKLKVTVGLDSKMNADAQNQLIEKNKYHISINPVRVRNKSYIIHCVLHEVGHLLYDWRKNDAEHEYLAELFAFKTAKENYPYIYPYMVKKLLDSLGHLNQDSIHAIGYLKVIKELKINPSKDQLHKWLVRWDKTEVHADIIDTWGHLLIKE